MSTARVSSALVLASVKEDIAKRQRICIHYRHFYLGLFEGGKVLSDLVFFRHDQDDIVLSNCAFKLFAGDQVLYEGRIEGIGNVPFRFPPDSLAQFFKRHLRQCQRADGKVLTGHLGDDVHAADLLLRQ